MLPATRRLRLNQSSSCTPLLDAHGEVKYNAWEKPTEIAKWKEEHIVFLVLGGWGVGIWGAMKAFGGKKEEAPVAK